MQVHKVQPLTSAKQPAYTEYAWQHANIDVEQLAYIVEAAPCQPITLH